MHELCIPPVIAPTTRGSKNNSKRRVRKIKKRTWVQSVKFLSKIRAYEYTLKTHL